jgi:hypothetical protein
MSSASRESFGTALGPYAGASLAEWHMADLTDEAERARLASEARATGETREAPAARPRRRHRLLHGHVPAADSH